MCIFSGEAHVSKTRIFARRHGDRQALAYQMSVEIGSDTAMILPIPLTKGLEDDVVFTSFEDHDDFFDKLDAMFFTRSRAETFGSKRMGRSALEVHNVGSFEASVVPTMKDFDRLDDRFKLPAAAQILQYRDYAFVVFKLKPGKQKVHPMVFSFPSAESRIFFPTVHVHDAGDLHEEDNFDHSLYVQCDNKPSDEWQTSGVKAGDAMGTNYLGAIDTSALVYRREIRGLYRNADIFVGQTPTDIWGNAIGT